MAEAEQVVTPLGVLPEKVKVPTSLTPNEMRRLKGLTGKSLGELLGGDAEDMDQAPDRIQALVYCGLRRAGYEPTWEQAGDVSPDTEQVPADPLKPASSAG